MVLSLGNVKKSRASFSHHINSDIGLRLNQLSLSKIKELNCLLFRPFKLKKILGFPIKLLDIIHSLFIWNVI